MPTDKHRIAAYLPPEVDEKFQVFKKERGVGDSPALILILTEFFGVSREVSRSSSLDIDVLKSELLSELDNRFSELRDELLSKSLKSVEIIEQGLEAVKVSHDPLVDLQVTHQRLKVVELEDGFVDRPTIAQLSTRFGCDSSLVRKQKSNYKDEPEKFIAWSKNRDPEGQGWRFDEVDKVFDRA